MGLASLFRVSFAVIVVVLMVLIHTLTAATINVGWCWWCYSFWTLTYCCHHPSSSAVVPMPTTTYRKAVVRREFGWRASRNCVGRSSSRPLPPQQMLRFVVLSSLKLAALWAKRSFNGRGTEGTGASRRGASWP